MRAPINDITEGVEEPTNGHRATTADILNFRSAAVGLETAPCQRKWQKHHQELMKLRAALFEQSGRLARDASEEIPAFSMHMADSGTDSFDRDFTLGMLSSKQGTLCEIEEAIKRIENGTYGICELTGKPISSARLNAVPWTRFSLDAQKQLELEGALGHTQIGSLGVVKREAVPDAGSGQDAED
jgi:RNA polymerase-binding transcription factor DksA